ncbi:MAG: F0F1 ATP synthase subunit A [Pseudomonadota bacterium]
MAGNNPVAQFKISVIEEFSFLGYDISFTNSSLLMLISTLTIGYFMFPRKNGSSDHVPSRFQVAQEVVFSAISDMVHDSIGKKAKHYFPFIFTLFLFILSANMWGMLPVPGLGAFTSTSHIAVTAMLALIVFCVVIAVGVKNAGLGYFAHFAPKGVPLPMQFIIVPIEIASFLARPVTLAVRLCGNMVAGHIVLKIFGTFIVSLLGAGFLAVLGILPFFILLAMNALEFFVAFLQAYIFATLSCIYISESVEAH